MCARSPGPSAAPPLHPHPLASSAATGRRCKRWLRGAAAGCCQMQMHIARVPSMPAADGAVDPLDTVRITCLLPRTQEPGALQPHHRPRPAAAALAAATWPPTPNQQQASANALAAATWQAYRAVAQLLCGHGAGRDTGSAAAAAAAPSSCARGTRGWCLGRPGVTRVTRMAAADVSSSLAADH